MRTLLIDGDIRNPGLTRSLQRKPELGLVEVMLEQAEVDDVLLRDEPTPLALLPTVMRSRVTNTSDLLASASMGRLLQRFRGQFDYIVVDSPPSDRWWTPRPSRSGSMPSFRGRVGQDLAPVGAQRDRQQSVFQTKSLGVILNKADSKKMRLYRSYGSPEYYASRYESYYRD